MVRERKARLSEIRKAVGKTQAQVAAEVGVDPSTYSAWETGKNDIGTAQLVALADCLGCTPNDILGYRMAANHHFAVITPEEERLLSLWKLLAPNVRSGLMEILRATIKGTHT